MNHSELVADIWMQLYLYQKEYLLGECMSIGWTYIVLKKGIWGENIILSCCISTMNMGFKYFYYIPHCKDITGPSCINHFKSMEIVILELMQNIGAAHTTNDLLLTIAD